MRRDYFSPNFDDIDLGEMTIESIHMRVRRWRYAIQADTSAVRFMPSAQRYDLERRIMYQLEVQVASLAEGHSWTVQWPTTWWQHLKADLSEWLSRLSSKPVKGLDEVVQGYAVRQWLVRVARYIEQHVKWRSHTKTAYALFPTVPIPHGVDPGDVFVVFSN